MAETIGKVETRQVGVKGQYLSIVFISSLDFIGPSKALMRKSVSCAVVTKF